jgi:ribosomal protein S18 acetylase RimI-like enzyme
VISQLLGTTHVLSAFSCGEESLDRWLKVSALRAQQQGTGQTRVWHDGDLIVTAYYTLASHQIDREILPSKERGAVPPSVPAILLAKLALAETLHGQGLGADLLLDALTQCMESSRIVASRYVVVDAINEAAAKFYEKYGFKRLPDAAGDLRLARKMSSIAADLAAGTSS